MTKHVNEKKEIKEKKRRKGKQISKFCRKKQTNKLGQTIKYLENFVKIPI